MQKRACENTHVLFLPVLLIRKFLCQELCTDLGMSGVCPCFVSVEQPLACYVTNMLVNILPANRTEGNVKGGRYTYMEFSENYIL